MATPHQTKSLHRIAKEAEAETLRRAAEQMSALLNGAISSATEAAPGIGIRASAPTKASKRVATRKATEAERARQQQAKARKALRPSADREAKIAAGLGLPVGPLAEPTEAKPESAPVYESLPSAFTEFPKRGRKPANPVHEPLAHTKAELLVIREGLNLMAFQPAWFHAPKCDMTEDELRATIESALRKTLARLENCK